MGAELGGGGVEQYVLHPRRTEETLFFSESYSNKEPPAYVSGHNISVYEKVRKSYLRTMIKHFPHIPV